MYLLYGIMMLLFLVAAIASFIVYARHRRAADGWLGAAALTYAVFPVTQLLGRGALVGAAAIVVALVCMILSLRIRLRELQTPPERSDSDPLDS